MTGVQIHNWGAKFDDDSPNLEFVAPTSVYVVVNGEKTYLDLNSMPVRCGGVCCVASVGCVWLGGRKSDERCWAVPGRSAGCRALFLLESARLLDPLLPTPLTAHRSLPICLQSLTPRQTRLLALSGDGSQGGRSMGGGGGLSSASAAADQSDVVCNSGGAFTLREIDPPYLYNSRDVRRREKDRAARCVVGGGGGGGAGSK